MNGEQIKSLVKELCTKQVTYKDYQGLNSTTNLVWRQNETIVEQIIRQHLLDSHDEKIGILEAKILFYEEMISKSTFAPFLAKEEEEEKQPEPYQREMVFTQRQIENLSYQVFQITGEGEVMKLFNTLLGVNAV